MTASTDVIFKVATEPWELEQVYQLNYHTFVQEIPQHQENPSSRLIDKFDGENTYLICLRDREMIGMIALRGRRPFSLDVKLPNLDSYLPPDRRICEFRLLAVQREHRNGRVLLGLMGLVAQHCEERGYDLAIISGTTRQQKLYRHLGFVPFGPLVGSGDAMFQPMYLTLERAEEFAKPLLQLLPDTPPAPSARPLNLLPGPVGIAPEVRDALAGEPVSHRSERFADDLAAIKGRLRALVQARQVELLMGSGTLANDVVAGQIALLDQPGVVLANGEFGERLIDHATRARHAFATHRVGWGNVLTREAVARMLDATPRPSWLWAVHCETSTGVLNDLKMLREVTAARGVKLCLDCISSIGAVPVDLRGVYLASGVSGKGLASYPGLSMVYADYVAEPAPNRLPRYLDLGLYRTSEGIPFTLSSNLLTALGRALDRVSRPEHYAEVADLAAWLRAELAGLGFAPLAPPSHAAPAVLTLVVPPEFSSERVGADLREAGFLLSYQSRYLLERNWIQICLMGADLTRERLTPLLDQLRHGILRSAASANGRVRQPATVSGEW